MAPGKAGVNSPIDQMAPLPHLPRSLLTTKAACLVTRRPVIIFCFLKRFGSHLPRLWHFLCNEALQAQCWSSRFRRGQEMGQEARDPGRNDDRFNHIISSPHFRLR